MFRVKIRNVKWFIIFLSFISASAFKYLLNIYKIQEYLDLIQYSSNAERFYKTWIDDIDYINVTMRAIRRVQSDCALLNLCFTNEEIVKIKI